ncbi:MerR family transcriptional regulator [Enterococcus faecium]|uniref:MerR family transcriptional regulator n=1 Tax=Enterococcus faecium TaxID=1352 RepID=UPI001BDDAB2A|nr:MerR family transcriptional regulator [Enterococcus faecium]MCU2053264.1 MerR family transcriptional regulator [Enterococcus faecium]QVX07950.1 MerR family transcriptional regulator [Enterococcus faecium]
MNIKQVSEEKGISADTLRYYERIWLIPPVNRTKGGIRDYTEEDLKWVDFTICMRNAGLSIESLIEYIRLSSEGEATVFERRKLLIEESELLTKKIAEMQECLERLQGKIKKYDRVLSRNKMECIK